MAKQYRVIEESPVYGTARLRANARLGDIVEVGDGEFPDQDGDVWATFPATKGGTYIRFSALEPVEAPARPDPALYVSVAALRKAGALIGGIDDIDKFLGVAQAIDEGV